MDAISFKIPKKDKQFLEWYSNKVATPIGSLYRTATLEEFQNWKLNVLTSLYAKAEISFKQMCDVGDLSFSKGMLLLQELDLNPPIPEIIDDYTMEITMKNISSKDTSIYKNKKGLVRKSKEITFD